PLPPTLPPSPPRHAALPISADLLVSPQNIGRPRFYDAVGRLPEVETMATVVGVSLLEPDRGVQVQGLVSADGNLGRTIERPKIVDRKSTRLNSSHEWISYAV